MNVSLSCIWREHGAFWASLCPASFLMTVPEKQREQDVVTSAYFIPDQTLAGSHAARPAPPDARSRGEKAGSHSPALQAPLLHRNLCFIEKKPFAGSCCRSTIGPVFVDPSVDPSSWISNSLVYDRRLNGGCKGSLKSPSLCGTNP